jgi:16S rRNA (guanine966-N2)-methyltransferase
MRVVAGRLGGRRLEAPAGRDTRPTPDRVREALFASLADLVPGATVLDLYAGSGALGIEALSRGADRSVFVESDRRAVAILRGNLATLGLDAPVHATTAERFCAAPSGGPFDLVLCDPPYATPLGAVHERLVELHRAAALRPAGMVVVERDKRDPDLQGPAPGFLAPPRLRSYGDTVLLVHRITGEEPTP